MTDAELIEELMMRVETLRLSETLTALARAIEKDRSDLIRLEGPTSQAASYLSDQENALDAAASIIGSAEQNYQD